MRLALVVQWLLAARGDPACAATCRRFALGITLVQALWIARLWFPVEWLWPTFVLFMACELAVPIVAERRHGTPWHALARPPHCRALQPAAHHHAGRGGAGRHQRGGRHVAKLWLDAEPGAGRPGQHHAGVCAVVDVLPAALGRRAAPAPRARLFLGLRALLHLCLGGGHGRRAGGGGRCAEGRQASRRRHRRRGPRACASGPRGQCGTWRVAALRHQHRGAGASAVHVLAVGHLHPHHARRSQSGRAGAAVPGLRGAGPAGGVAGRGAALGLAAAVGRAGHCHRLQRAWTQALRRGVCGAVAVYAAKATSMSRARLSGLSCGA
ncbi:MAG: low temperature requirement protein A [Ottowia sp.]|nr:low temperature requirement protein A [Ottowia sp.]